MDPEAILTALCELLNMVVKIAPRETYGHNKINALKRIKIHDPDDWPVVALALTLEIPIWTQDTDFFGSGIATWTTDRVELYLKS